MFASSRQILSICTPSSSPARTSRPSHRGASSARASRPLRFVLGLTFACALVSLAPTDALAAKVLTIDSVPIDASLSLGEIEKRIKAAGTKRGWKSKTIAPGHIEAVIHVRTHIAKVDIKFDTTSYSIFYKDSKNLKYKEGKIHRAYNNWVTNLKNDIEVELSF